jgi:hypothetical protein
MDTKSRLKLDGKEKLKQLKLLKEKQKQTEIIEKSISKANNDNQTSDKNPIVQPITKINPFSETKTKIDVKISDKKSATSNLPLGTFHI